MHPFMNSKDPCEVSDLFDGPSAGNEKGRVGSRRKPCVCRLKRLKSPFIHGLRVSGVHPSGNCSSRGDSAGPERKSRSGAAGKWRRRPSCIAGKRWPLGPALYPARLWNLMSRTLGPGRSARLPRPTTLRCSFSSATCNRPLTGLRRTVRDWPAHDAVSHHCLRSATHPFGKMRVSCCSLV